VKRVLDAALQQLADCQQQEPGASVSSGSSKQEQREQQGQ
jgi:hypothetical protein